MPKASVILRVHNEQRYLKETLEAVFAQSVRDVEVVIVDSGSTDHTLDIARSFPVRIVTIKPQEFTYGHALNVGARAAHGRYLVSLSGHATPLSDLWLETLLAGFTGPEVAGTFSRLVARPGAYLYQKMLAGVFYGPKALDLTTYCAFHNTSSAVRRELWQSLPFQEDMPAGEDQAWARRAKAIGYRIVYAPESRVWHSHDGENLLRFMRRTWLRDWRGLTMIALDYLKGHGLDLKEQRAKLRVKGWRDAPDQAR